MGTFLVLAGAWEAVLRARAGETVEFAIMRPKMSVPQTGGERWIVFGNCLVMTGISPKQLATELGGGDRVILNIASHEQSPIAYFNYLRRTNQYPDVILANVSSWINGTNFEQETQLVMETDPLDLVPDKAASRPGHDQAYRGGDELGGGAFQKRVEAKLAQTFAESLQVVGHRYHLFDYAMFLGTFVTSAGDLDNALYQLNIQSWFRVTGSETDGFGYVGLDIDYRADWPAGLEQMAERYIKRMRFSHLLGDAYWSQLADNIREFQKHGTRILIVRMPEHPKIRAFNDETYALPARLRELETLGAQTLDLSQLGPADGIHLFDSVHPDAKSGPILAREIAKWMRAIRVAARVTP